LSANEVTRIPELVYELRVGDVARKNVITVGPATEMKKLRSILRENRISGVPVVDGGKIVGIVSMEDFIRWLADGAPECKVESRMMPKVVTAFEDEPVVAAVNKLEKFGFGRLPVVARSNRQLLGIVTKGDIMAGLLKKLDVDCRKKEKHNARSSHVFEDIVADRSSLILEYKVAGGDFKSAGASASGLKTTLLRLGMAPETVRRTAIAAYEAEMNLIFFTDGGGVTAEVGPKIIKLKVVDRGPGIPDIEQARRRGYSTAPQWVRELGFGAGMGLYNIEKSADGMKLDSVVGKGTTLEVDFFVESEKK
jgi:CBS domain-containing protein/anti-sigma regulatory factor (Ser/Thr protein kinase)